MIKLMKLGLDLINSIDWISDYSFRQQLKKLKADEEMQFIKLTRIQVLCRCFSRSRELKCADIYEIETNAFPIFMAGYNNCYDNLVNYYGYNLKNCKVTGLLVNILLQGKLSGSSYFI